MRSPRSSGATSSIGSWLSGNGVARNASKPTTRSLPSGSLPGKPICMSTRRSADRLAEASSPIPCPVRQQAPPGPSADRCLHRDAGWPGRDRRASPAGGGGEDRTVGDIARLQRRVEGLENQVHGLATALVGVLCADGHADSCLAGHNIGSCKEKCAAARAALEELFAHASFAFSSDADFMQRARAALIRPETAAAPPRPAGGATHA